MLNAKNNAALRAYINFKEYRKTVEELDKYGSEPENPVKKKGLMTISNTMKKKNPVNKNNESDKELRTVLEYVKMIEDMKGGN
tara:strand:+ start:3045 stop:3293 length:249 start_codon:yes stop_codon:yes gene_type:complete